MLSLTNQYNRDLTATYIKYLDLLLHNYKKQIDGFPNKIRTELNHFSITILTSEYLEDVSNYIALQLYTSSINDWIEEHTTTLLTRCHEFAIEHNLDVSLKTVAHQARDCVQEQQKVNKTNRFNNSRYIDIDFENTIRDTEMRDIEAEGFQLINIICNLVPHLSYNVSFYSI